MNRNMVMGTALGAVIGSIVGLLVAPKSGQETRDDLKHKAQDLGERAKEGYYKAKDSAAEGAGRFKRAASTFKDELTPSAKR